MQCTNTQCAARSVCLVCERTMHWMALSVRCQRDRMRCVMWLSCAMHAMHQHSVCCTQCVLGVRTYNALDGLVRAVPARQDEVRHVVQLCYACNAPTLSVLHAVCAWCANVQCTGWPCPCGASATG